MFYLALAIIISTVYGILFMVTYDKGDAFLETNIRLFTHLAFAVAFALAMFTVVWSIVYILPESTKEAPKPVILVCDGRTVAESNNGSYVNSKSGIYEDKRTTLTYTPKQGEMCQVFLK